MTSVTTRRSLEVLTTDDSDHWDEVLHELATYDFYNLASFHRLSELRGQGKAEMLVYREGDYTLIYPMLIRDIDIPPVAHEGLKDATSVPGLVGPLASALSVPDDVRLRFIHALQTHFEDNSIITAYCRLNCLIDQQPLFKGYGQTITHGVEISLDLTIPPEEQFARYRRDNRKAVRKLTGEGFTCEEVGAEHLDEFIRIYYYTMDRKNAAPVYYFDRAYFDFLMNEMSDVTHLFFTKDGERTAAVGIYIECRGYVHAYFGGTDGDYIERSPSKLLTDWVRRWSVDRGCRMLHLGAGGGTQRDSLWDYKMAFGGQEHEYSSWRQVVSPGIYDDVCRRVSEHAGIEPEESYFPKYRHPALRGDG